MPMLEDDYKWTWSTTTSTVAMEAHDCRGYAQSISFYVETGAGCTATVNVQTRAESSNGPYASLSTTSMSTGSVQILQFLGPMSWMRPYVTSKSTGDLTIRLMGT